MKYQGYVSRQTGCRTVYDFDNVNKAVKTMKKIALYYAIDTGKDVYWWICGKIEGKIFIAYDGYEKTI